MSRKKTILELSVRVAAILFLVVTAYGQSNKDTVELERQIQEAIRASGAETVAVAFYDLETKAQLTLNADVSFHAASTMKLPVMMEVFRQAHEGKLSLDTQLPVQNEFKSIADASSFSTSPEDDSEQTLYKRVGQTASVRDLVTLMIGSSSNLATNILIERVTPNRIMDLLMKNGAPSMRVLRGVEDGKAFERGLNNTTTARDLMTILRRIAEGRVVSKTASNQMIDIMVAQKFNEGIPAGLPSAACVAHKTGSITKINHDAGIIYPPGTRTRKPYVLVVLTRGIGEEQRAHKLIADVSRLVYEGLD